ncbi:MAG: TonB-dependent receptor plug domain-containing protein, partial [Steroidobacteraceae bacterium]
MGTLSSVFRGWPAAVLSLGTLVLGLAPSGAGAADVSRQFDIPAEPLGSALDEFARQANVTLLFSSSLVAREQTSGVHGELAVTAALGRLLGGTGLAYRQVSPAAIAIIQPPGRRAPPPNSRAPHSSFATAEAPRNGVLHRLGGVLTRAAEVFGGGSRNRAAPADAQSAPSYNSLQEVVVTGTPEVSGVRLLDASFPVSAASLAQIQLAQPSSAADLLKIVPGLWAESSGGETGANIEVAGFPGGGDAPYVTYQIEGSPVYPAPTLSFMDNSSLLRLDDTIDRIEVVQGGPSVVYSNGQIGATTNIILR